MVPPCAVLPDRLLSSPSEQRKSYSCYQLDLAPVFGRTQDLLSCAIRHMSGVGAINLKECYMSMETTTSKAAGPQHPGQASVIQPILGGSSQGPAAGIEPNPGDSGQPNAGSPECDSPTEASARAASGAEPEDQGPWASQAAPDTGTRSRSKDYRDAEYVEARLRSSPLAEGEDQRDYDALAREIFDAVQPKNIFDHMKVADLIHFLWEEGRYREQRVALPHATRFKAAVVLLMPHTQNFEFQAGRTALDYLCGDPEARERATRFMRSVGITDAAIAAQAAELHGQSIAALDRLIGQSQSRRGAIIKEVERDKRKAEKNKAKLKGEGSGPGTSH
jgi:hypothetical protein